MNGGAFSPIFRNWPAAVDATRRPVLVRIAADPPGVPQAKIDDTETPPEHGIGVGLWLTNRAIQGLGGKRAVLEPGASAHRRSC